MARPCCQAQAMAWTNVDYGVYDITRPQWINKLEEKYLLLLLELYGIETVSSEGPFCDTVQVPSGVGDMQLIYK